MIYFFTYLPVKILRDEKGLKIMMEFYF